MALQGERRRWRRHRRHLPGLRWGRRRSGLLRASRAVCWVRSLGEILYRGRDRMCRRERERITPWLRWRNWAQVPQRLKLRSCPPMRWVSAQSCTGELNHVCFPSAAYRHRPPPWNSPCIAFAEEGDVYPAVSDDGIQGGRCGSGALVAVDGLLGEAGALDLLAEVFAVHLHHHTHLLQAGAHAFADAVSEGLLADGVAYGVSLLQA
jgi:hypothetical protein